MVTAIGCMALKRRISRFGMGGFRKCFSEEGAATRTPQDLINSQVHVYKFSG